MCPRGGWVGGSKAKKGPGSFFWGMFLLWCFRTPLAEKRETPKNVLKKVKGEKKSDGGWVGLGFSKFTGGFVEFFVPAPRAICPM